MTDYDGGTPASEFSTTDGVIDYTTPGGQVRLLITDTAPAQADWLFTEDQISAFLNMHGDNVYRAASQALRVIAASEVLVGKVIRTQAGTSTDGSKVSAELRALAAQYDAQADSAEPADEGFFDVIGYCPPSTAEGVEARWY